MLFHFVVHKRLRTLQTRAVTVGTFQLDGLDGPYWTMVQTNVQDQ